MKVFEGAIRDYTYSVQFHLSPYAPALMWAIALTSIVLSYILFFRVKSPPARRIAFFILVVLTVLSVLVAAYEWWYWGELNYIVLVNLVPIAVMDATAAVAMHFHLKGIGAALAFLLFASASLLYIGNTILGELIPVNRIVGGGLHALIESPRRCS